MDTRAFRRLIRRRWRSILAGTLIVGVLTLFVDLLQPPVYQASATLLVNQNRGLTAPSYESVLMSQQLTRTYAELLKKRPLYEGVIASLSLDHDT
jgi:succinoglycan biosynthesis transport protein ExoP